MKNILGERHLWWFLLSISLFIGFCWGGGERLASAVASFQAALKFNNTSSSWTAATGTSGGRGIRWDTAQDLPIVHQSSGAEIPWGTSSAGLPTALAVGDTIAWNGASWSRIGVGSNAQVLTADSTQSAGVKWSTPAGGLFPSMLFSIVDYGQNGPGFTAQSGNTKLATRFMFQKPVTVTGVRFGWAGAATTIKVQMFNTSMTQLAVGTAAVSTTGVITISFSSPFAVSGSNVGKTYVFSVYDTSGTQDTVLTIDPTNWPFPDLSGSAGTGVAIQNEKETQLDGKFYGVGDVFPGTGPTTGAFPLEPIVM